MMAKFYVVCLRFAEEFQGKNVLGEGNTAVIAALAARGALLKEEEYAHKYPYDWRTKKPTIFRATAQWFASVEGFRGEALDAIKGKPRVDPPVFLGTSVWFWTRHYNMTF